MLKLNPNPTFAWPIKFMTPEGEQTLKVIYRHMPKEQYEAWWAAAVKRSEDHFAALTAHQEATEKAIADGKEPPSEIPKPAMSGLDELMEIMAGWEEVDTPFSRDALNTLLGNYHDLNVMKISRGWIEGLQQRKLEN